MLDKQLLQDLIDQHKIERLFVAYSGGADSSALLHLCSKLEVKHIKALHVNHGLSNQSKKWQKHCAKQANLLNIQFNCTTLTPPPRLSNIESWARDKRMDFFRDEISGYEDCAIVTGHHLQDQAETFILNALRGSGVKGLSAIKEVQKFANGYLIRPFLAYTKQQLLKYCKDNNTSWVEDESNSDTKYRRNAIRHNILPAINQLSINSTGSLARSAKLCNEAQDVIDYYIKQEIIKIIDGDSKTLELSSLTKLPELIQKQVLIYWFNNTLKIKPSFKQLEQIMEGVQKSRSGWSYKLKPWDIDISKKHISAKSAATMNKTSSVPKSTVMKWLHEHDKLKIDDNLSLSLRNRQPNDKCKYPGRKHSQKLKILFQELDISVEQRKNLKIIFIKDKPERIVAVYPFFVCPEFLL